MAQLHKKFSDNQIRDLIARYVEKKIKRIDAQKVLGIGKTRFFALVKEYKEDPKAFSVEYIRKNATNKISPETEELIVSELKLEKSS